MSAGFTAAPRWQKMISPNKTWSGFGGALVFPAAFGVLWCTTTDLSIIFTADRAWYIEYITAGVLGAVIGSVGPSWRFARVLY